jgi:hypothetical protein
VSCIQSENYRVVWQVKKVEREVVKMGKSPRCRFQQFGHDAVLKSNSFTSKVP